MKKKTISILLLVSAMPLLLSFSCHLQPEANSGSSLETNTLCVASWNVQNLFDEIEDGTEYDEYKTASGWNKDAFNSRLSDTAQALSYLPKAKNYIIVLNEVENSKVVASLLSQRKMKDKGLAWYAFASYEDAAMGSTVISSIPIVNAKVHGVDAGLRPVLEVEFDVNGGKLYLLSVHFKSNVGGQTETAPMRLQAAQVVSQVSSELKKNNPGCLILICGDFNEEVWDDNAMSRFSQVKAPLKVSGVFSNGIWYCPWLDSSQNLWPNGSYYYNDLWKGYDNILISQEGQDGTGLEYVKAGVLFQGILRTSDDKPNAWQRQLLKGVSDHLPVWVLLD
jgi:endonuclease/exonuclease/phosphatase family metal-dependent hydrolase